MVTNITVHDNTAYGSGGGIYCNASSPTITNAILWGNKANISGPEISVGSGSPVVRNASPVEV